MTSGGVLTAVSTLRAGNLIWLVENIFVHGHFFWQV